MVKKWTTDRFPQFEKELRHLTEQHLELKDEPLHLALAYQPSPSRDQQDIYLFEAIGFGSDGNPNQEFFETTFEPNGLLRSGFDERLHLILTTPAEFKIALEQRWSSAEEIVHAVRHDDYQVLQCDSVGEAILDLVKKAAGNHEVATHG